ncbi:ATP-binding protein [Microbacterium sp. zg-YB36]|uniref:ATP-binding protein n=1 Tax=Microbacterium sp. zg-YB36 TaxID=2969407 RepID=UPI00214AC289|nr:ATP-binding protein [Microbacterium sp. zg-YB36]MDL5352769.1 ATP-binding protein [Microbacterium sp. zg-YB36]
MLYNDAYIPTVGPKHPALGEKLSHVFAEIWDDIGPMQRSVLAGGPAVYLEDFRLSIELASGLTENFFTFSYSHVPDDEGPGGVLTVMSLTTRQVVAARRLALLHRLALEVDRALAPHEAMDAALQVLSGASEDLVGGALYTRTKPSDGAAPIMRRLGVFGEVGCAEFPERIHSSSHPVAHAWQGRSPVRAQNGRAPAGRLPTSWVAIPVHGQGEVEAVLALFPHPLRPADTDQDRFLELIADQIGQILGMATARDRERARLEAMAALDAAKTAFLSNVSHEFRTPLTLLLGPLQDVVDGRASAIERAEAEVMRSTALRLLWMVNTLLDVARIEEGGMVATPEMIDVAQITGDLLRPFELAARRTGLQLHSDLDPTLGQVLVDPELWEKIVLNLVANAIKFTLRGSVRVMVAARDGRLVLRVSDTGVGIPSSEIPHVFDRFHRVRDDDTRSVEGTGLGLALVAEAARAMSGTATVRSEPGMGSAFEVTLPLVRTGPASRWSPHVDVAMAIAEDLVASDDQEIVRVGQQPPLGRDGPAILVVEDNAALRSRLARLLSDLGTVTAVPDGVAALEILRSEQVSLVVTDVMMPRMDGLTLLQAIRGDESLRRIPVVLLSAVAGSEAAAGAIEAGADDYVVKPFTPGELLARCRMNLELAEYRATAAASNARGALLAGVSHDMQTPLSVITSALDLLSEPSMDEGRRRGILTRAQVRAAQLSRLVTQFLDWSRLNMSEPLPIRVGAVDLKDIISEIVSEHEQIAIRVTGDPEREVWCDDRRTAQILHNLVENAERVARTHIEIRIESDDDLCVVRVVDDGSGVSPEVLPLLFEAFGPTTAAKGNGLGLHISRAAAQAQGGALELESTGPEGSVFALRLPRRRPC